MNPEVNSPRGLFTGFEGYRSPTDDEIGEAMTGSLVALDTNVLLSLYNFHGTTLDDLFKVFEALDDRLFVPHQVVDEFWRNRRNVLAENQGKHRERAKIEESFEEIRASFTKWYARVVDRVGTPPVEVVRELDEAVDAMLQYVDSKSAESAPTNPDTPTSEDSVLARLANLLEGKVGPSPSAKELPQLMKEAQRRVQERIPPGYLDAAKAGDRSTGDFFVWQQTMEESKRRGLPVLLVTQDQKEDWWADRGTKSMRARPELVQELFDVSGQRLLMVRSYDLLRFADRVGVAVSDTTLKDAVGADTGSGGWTGSLVDTYYDLLMRRWPSHFLILLEAMGDDEFCVSRAAIADLIGREHDAPMTGITRPFHTAIKVLREGGMVDEDLLVPIYPWYGEGNLMTHLGFEESLLPTFASRLDYAEELARELGLSAPDPEASGI